MKIVITGCTGFVGQQIIPHLLRADAELLLVGRDIDKVSRLYPDQAVCGYDGLAERARGFDVLVHLAVLNNDAEGSIEDFRRVNVDLVRDVAQAAKQAGIRRIVAVSTFHALDNASQSAYAQSKREGLAVLEGVGVDVVTLMLPAVYGDHWAGKLAMLNRLPTWLRKPAFDVVSALKPVVDARKIANFIVADSLHAPREVLLYDDKAENRAYLTAKRVIDLSFAVLIAALFGWLLILVWLLVKMQSPGPGIFAQTRVGFAGRAFTCYKFRTMAQGTKQAGTHEVTVSAVTSVGRFLRRTKLDELPQIWNIVRNEVSLVGPRPCLPNQTELVTLRQAAGVYRMKPGITGYAQINDVDMSDPARLTVFDARYLATRSLVLDLRILIATVLGRGQGDRTASLANGVVIDGEI